MEQDETGVIKRWQQFTQRVRAETLPRWGGVLVKSLGDGMMLTFNQALDAISAAQHLRNVMDEVNRAALVNQPHNEDLVLRTGIHSGEVMSDDLDIYGHNVNIAARITALGSPGDVIISTDTRECLPDWCNETMDDLGKHHLKHMQSPVHIYRVNTPMDSPTQLRARAYRVNAVH